RLGGGRRLPKYHCLQEQVDTDDEAEADIDVPVRSFESLLFEAVALHGVHHRRRFRVGVGSPRDATGMAGTVEQRKDCRNPQKMRSLHTAVYVRTIFVALISWILKTHS